MADSRPDAGRRPLPAQLAHALVAFTVELDNQFEHEMPHRTTRHGSTPGHPRAPWLVSYPMWVHCLRYVPDDGIPAGVLVRRSGLTAATMQHVVKRLADWWGYLSVGPPGDGRGAGSAASRLVSLSPAGRQAQAVWRPLEAIIEDRWRDRFGAETIGRLRVALGDIVGRLDPGLPDYLPVGELSPRPVGAGGPAGGREPAAGAPAATAPGLPVLISRVLLALTLDFEGEAGPSAGITDADRVPRLVVSANVLRVIDEGGTRVAAVPALTGVAKMAVDNQLSALSERGFVVVGPDPGGTRFKVVTPTARGRRAQELYRRWTGEVEERLAERFGPAAGPRLREALAALGGDGSASPLRLGMEPYPDGWRARVPRLVVLPDYPVVSLRGGFPDGS